MLLAYILLWDITNDIMNQGNKMNNLIYLGVKNRFTAMRPRIMFGFLSE